MPTDSNIKSGLFNKLETDYLKVTYHEFPGKCSGVYKSNECSALRTIIQGTENIRVGSNGKFSYDSSQFILLPPETSIDIDIDSYAKSLVFELKSELLKYVSDRVNFDFNVDYNSFNQDKFLLGSLTPVLRESINKILNIILNPDKNLTFLLDLYAQELVYELMQIRGAIQILSFEFQNPVNKAIKYMHDNWSEPVSLKKISAELNMSESSFSQCFKRAMGITPKEYLTDIKLSKAKDMINHASVSEVAYDLGYDNISHFISLFKNKYGLTPKQYKKKFEDRTSSFKRLN